MRVKALYGDVFVESNLTGRTKAALGDLYGPVSMAAGQHVQAIARAGRMVNAAGKDSYLRGARVPDIPILLLHGSRNDVSLRSGAQKSLNWLRSKQPGGHFEAIISEEYGHDDSLIGHQAPVEVFPVIARHLEAYRNG
jgi:cholesterol oxidase